MARGTRVVEALGPWLTRVLVGGVLLLAAYMKGADWLADGGVNARVSAPGADGFATVMNRYGVPALLAVECVLGIWLASGWRWRAARIVGICWMGVLAGVSLYWAATGAKSCGCFGKIAVNPWLTFGLDLCAMAALAATPGAMGASRRAWRQWGVAAGQAGMIVLIGLILRSPMRAAVPAGLVEVHPADWNRTEPWPVGQYVDVWGQISHGKWVVIVYGSQCKMCMAVRDDYETLAEKWRAEKAPVRVALIDTMADVADPGDIPTTADAPAALYGALHEPADADWYVPTPMLVILVDGRVVEAAQGYDDVQWGERVFPK